MFHLLFWLIICSCLFPDTKIWHLPLSCLLVNQKTLSSCFAICFLPWLRLYRMLGNSEQKSILQIIEQLIQLFKFFRSSIFLNKSRWRGISQCFIDKCSHLFIFISLKYTQVMEYITLDRFLPLRAVLLKRCSPNIRQAKLLKF